MKKGSISFDFHWPDHNRKINIEGLPESLSDIIQEQDGFLLSFSDRMIYGEDYRVTITIEKIEKTTI